MNEALTKPAQHSNTEIFFRARALYEDAILAEHLDDIPRIKASTEQSLRLAQGASDKREIAIARLYKGLALWRQNDYDRAFALSNNRITIKKVF